MAVSASFIEGLLAKSQESSDAGESGKSVADASAGVGEGAGDPGRGKEPGQQGPDSVGVSGAAAGAKTAAESQPSAEAGKQPAVGGEAQPVATEVKPPANDDPVTQIGRLNGALREVRGENKELKTLLAKQSEQFSALQKQVEALGQPKPAAVEPEAEPDFLADPKVYVDKTLAKATDAVKKLQDADAQRAEQAKRQEEMQQQWGEVLSKEAEFTAETPDYNQALQFVRGIRVRAYSAEFEALNDRGPTQAEISKALTQQEIQGALLLQSKGKNPAQWYYNYAKSLGYKTPEPAAPVVADTPAAAAPAKPAAAKPDKEAVKSMGSGGSSAGPSEEDASRDPLASVLGTVHGEMTAKRKARRG